MSQCVWTGFTSADCISLLDMCLVVNDEVEEDNVNHRNY